MLRLFVTVTATVLQWTFYYISFIQFKSSHPISLKLILTFSLNILLEFARELRH